MFSHRHAVSGSIRSVGRLLALLLAGSFASLFAQQSDDLQPRQFAAVAHNSQSDQFLLFGGTYGYQRFDDTWLFGATGWKILNPSTNPGERISSAAAYDSARDEFVLFGGRVKNVKPSLCSPGAIPKELNTEFFCKDTWVFDGKKWTKKTPATSPSERERHAMAYDVATKQVVLFGGISDPTATPLSDTWVWDGTTWKQMVTIHKPPARCWHTMAYDPIHQQIVMFGGDGGERILNDTWLWNGTDWLAAPHQTTTPELRTGAGMDYSPTLGKMVLFSGSTWNDFRVGIPSFDSWSWDGNQWNKLDPFAFQLITDFSTLTSEETRKAILANGTPTILWIPR